MASRSPFAHRRRSRMSGCALAICATVLGGCGGSSFVASGVPRAGAARALYPAPFDPRTATALRGVLPIPGAALAAFPHELPAVSHTASRGPQNTADHDDGGQAGYIIDPGAAAGDGGIAVAMTAYGDAWVTTPTDGSYNTINAPTTHGPNGNCIETVTNYYNGFGTPGTTVDQIQFYDFCANGGQGAFVGAIPIDATFIRDYVRTYEDGAHPLPRYVSVVEYVAGDRRYHAYLYNASLQRYVDYYDSPAGATTTVLGGEGWSIYETHDNGGDCTALPDASEADISVHGPGGWRLLNAQNVYSYTEGTCFTPPLNAPYDVPAFSAAPGVGWTVTAPVAPAQSPYARAILSAAPVAYYRLNDRGAAAADQSAYHAPATYGANVVHTASLLASESLDGAALFGGGAPTAADVVRVAAAPRLQPTLHVSVEAWVKPAGSPHGAADLVAYGARPGGPAYALQLTAGGLPAAAIATSAGGGGVSGTIPLAPDRSALLDMTYDGSRLTLYVDGALAGAANVSGDLVYGSGATAGGLALGAAYGSTEAVFSGALSDVAVYAATLTAAQIGSHWTAGSGTLPPSGSPYASAVLADAPAALFALDDRTATAADGSANRIAATYGASVTRGVAGLLSDAPTATAAGFPGGPSSPADAVTTDRSAKLEPARTVSVETWLAFAADPTGTVDLVSYGHERTGQPYTLQLLPSGRIAMYLRTATGSGYLRSTSVVTPNAAHLIDGTYDGATLRLYVDGNLDAATPANGTLDYAALPATDGLSIGTAFDTSRMGFAGTLADVAVYPTALGAARIGVHWAVGSGHAPSP